MSEAVACAAAPTSRPGIGFFERYLTLWVALCIVVGTALGHFLPGSFAALGAMEVAKVNLPVAVLILLVRVALKLKPSFATEREEFTVAIHESAS